MSKMFAYQYVWDKEKDEYTSIKDDKKVCLRMNNFIYLELPLKKWTDCEIQHIHNKVNKYMLSNYSRYNKPIVKIMKQQHKSQYTPVIMWFFKTENHMHSATYMAGFPFDTDFGPIDLIPHFQKDGSYMPQLCYKIDKLLETLDTISKSLKILIKKI